MKDFIDMVGRRRLEVEKEQKDARPLASRQGFGALIAFGSGIFLAFLLLPMLYSLILRETQSRVQAQTQLMVANEQLEARVTERTSQLEGANISLRAEMALRERIGAELRESEARFRDMADTAPALLWLTDENLKCIWVNRRWRELTVRVGSREEDDYWLDIHPHDREQWLSAMRKARERRSHFEMEFRMWGEGGYRWMLAAGTPRSAPQFIGFIGSCLDIAARKQAEADKQLHLEREQSARKEAEDLNHAKDEFLHILSHELRTPLTSIMGWSNLLRSGQLDPETVNTALEVIERQVRAEALLIGELTDLSQISSGKLRLTVRTIDVAPVLAAAAESVRPALDAKEINLQVDIQQNLPAILADAERLQQIVWNLLANSIKFTPRGGLIKLQLGREESSLRLTVTDTGIGISADFLPYVFDRFRQADSSATRPAGGLGLGLAIVRQLVEMQGGTVSASSQGPNLGATFTVRFPVAAARQGDPALAPRPSSVVADGAAPSTMDDALKGLNLLVVEDDADSRLLLTSILRQHGAHVYAAKSGSEALELLRRFQPDVLISDIGMPEMDGIDFIRRVRAWSGQPKTRTPSEGNGVHSRKGEPVQISAIPAIALTAYSGAEDRSRALKAGYGAYLLKPVEPAELVSRIAEIAGRSQA